MTGDNCCVVGCSANKDKCRSLSFHSLPKKGLSEQSDRWRDELIKKINRSDKSFNPNRAKICARHFEDSCFLTKPSGRHTLVFGSLPTQFMPAKSIETPKPPPRKPPKKRSAPEVSRVLEPQNSTGSLRPCPGIVDSKLQRYAKLPPPARDEKSPSYYLHASYGEDGDRVTCTTTIRAHECIKQLQAGDTELCSPCRRSRIIVLKKHARRCIAEKKNIQKNTPLSKLSKKNIKNALKLERLEKNLQRKQLQEIQSKLREDVSVDLSEKSHEKLTEIMDVAKKDSFVSKFWEEQKKAFSRKKGGMRWHPMMVRFAVLLHSQSPSAYRTVRKTGVLQLPAESTLRDYTNILHPRSGFMLEVFLELKNLAASLEENQRWVVLLHDELSIKQDLVYDRVTGELVGFIDKSQWTDATAKQGHLATHALVFMAVGVTSNIKMSLGYVPTMTATADQIFPWFWQAVGLLETVCNLKVIASTSDKASPNQRLLRMHTDNGYKAQNLYAPERDIFFFSDAPHLLKTVRNNLASSGFGKNTKTLWNNGMELLWTHIVRLYQEDSGRELRRTKLTSDHIYLSPQSIMRVYLAAQVLSHSVGSVLQTFGGPDCQETAKFVLLMDKFFDCLNVSSSTEGTRHNNPFLAPYTSADDHRFQFLAQEFLGYIEDWKEAVMARPGFSKAERNKMFLSQPTYEGLKTTVKSAIETTQYLLRCGVKMVLTHKFCQDPLEEHFGRHRALGVRAENPSLWTYGYQENKLRLQRSLALCLLPRGNIRGKRCANKVLLDNTPLPKKRHRH